jgi:hypothetical protein
MLKILRNCLLSVVFSILLFSCSDEALNIDNSMQPKSDQIEVYAGLFTIQTAWGEQGSVLSRINTDYFLLGSITDKVFGKTNAEILAQFACPIDLKIPSNVDSTALTLELKVSSFIAEGDSTININVYKMDLGTFSYRGSYNSEIDPSLYCSKSEKIGSASFKAHADSTVVEIVLDDALRDELIAAAQNDNSIYASQAAFFNFLKGLYIEVESGNAMLSVYEMDMYLFSRYKNEAGVYIGQTSIFPANKEVRQVNKIKHDYTGGDYISTSQDSVMFVSSPAGTISKLTIPLGKISQQFVKDVKDGIPYADNDRKLSFNSAIITITVADTANTLITPPPYLLLVKESEATNFFAKDKSADNITSMVGYYDASTISYSFRVHKYLAKELSVALDENATDNLLLIPVDGEYNSTYGTLSKIRYAYNFYASSLGTEKHPTNPIKFEVVVSGF